MIVNLAIALALSRIAAIACFVKLFHFIDIRYIDFFEIDFSKDYEF